MFDAKRELFMAYEEKFMLDALKEADKAPAEHEVPVGAVVVCEGKIIARAQQAGKQTVRYGARGVACHRKSVQKAKKLEACRLRAVRDA